MIASAYHGKRKTELTCNIFFQKNVFFKTLSLKVFPLVSWMLEFSYLYKEIFQIKDKHHFKNYSYWKRNSKTYEKKLLKIFYIFSWICIRIKWLYGVNENISMYTYNSIKKSRFSLWHILFILSEFQFSFL